MDNCVGCEWPLREEKHPKKECERDRWEEVDM